MKRAPASSRLVFELEEPDMTKPFPRDGVLAIDPYVPGKSAAARSDGARARKQPA